MKRPFHLCLFLLPASMLIAVPASADVVIQQITPPATGYPAAPAYGSSDPYAATQPYNSPRRNNYRTYPNRLQSTRNEREMQLDRYMQAEEELLQEKIPVEKPMTKDDFEEILDQKLEEKLARPAPAEKAKQEAASAAPEGPSPFGPVGGLGPIGGSGIGPVGNIGAPSN